MAEYHHSNSEHIKPELKHKTHIQPVRQTLSSQFRNNPFSKLIPTRSRCVSTRNFFEFTNYKLIPNEDSEKKGSHSMLHATSNKKLHGEEAKKGKKLKKPTKKRFNLHKMSTKECIVEMMNEIDMNMMLTEFIEKEFTTIAKFVPIGIDEISEKKLNLPKSSHFMNTVLLDLDETLIHTFLIHVNGGSLNELPVMSCTYCGDRVIQFVKRPYLDHFLLSLSKYYEVIVFTASEKSYADAVINCIDENKCISHRIYRNNCIQRDKWHIKDLRILNRDINHCIIIDNSIISFMSQLDNGIPIKSFVGDPNDRELLEVNKLLIEIKNCTEVKKQLKSKYFLSQLYLKTTH